QTEQTEQTASEELLTKKDLPLERNIDQEIPTRITVTPTSDPTPISISDKTKKDINYKVSKFFNEILDIHDDTIISSSSRAYCNIHKSIINSRENEAIIQTKEFQDTLFKENNEQLHQAINKFINELIRFTAIIWNDERKRIVAEQTSDGDNISDDCTLPQPTFISNLYYALKKKEEVVETEQITPDTEKEASAKPVVVVPAQNKEPQPTSNEYVRSKEQTKRAAENLLALNGIDRSQIYQLIKTNQISDVTLKLISRGGNILYKIDEIRERADKLPRLRPYAFNVA
ncbi:MAG: hypothetical protein KAG53_08220, partial [Endozoicomonadaceae bacterium]|nr:hypothetical protein [Endozoicomonadaceae bacterium]